MAKGQLIISIDLELAWGVWDHVTPEDLRLAAEDERPICATLVELFDRHQIPATWAIVAALLDEPSSVGLPGHRGCWHAPEVIEQIARAKVRHEIGSHGGRHRYFDSMTAAQAREDLEFAREQHRAHALPFDSFVFPRNSPGHFDVLRAAGLRAFRGRDRGWFMTAGAAGRIAGRSAHLVDKLLPIPPTPVSAQWNAQGLVDIPGSMLLLGRSGLRRFVSATVTRAKLAMGLARARDAQSIFHFWFHPSNFYYRRDEQLATLAWFLGHAADEASRGRIEILTMGDCARRLIEAEVPAKQLNTRVLQ
jgi:peptidoglycan/xylan/chitin deacetylase (PgdA/CDA1 family)